MQLSGKTALVTGANRGIGAAMVAALAPHCQRVLAGVRDPSAFTPSAGNVEPLRVDLASRESIDDCFAAAHEQFEAVDLLVNNAGLLSVGLLEQQELDRIYASLQVNLAGAIHLTKLVLPSMLARGEGMIVNNASMSGYAYFPLASVYAAGKAGIVAFSESLRREVAPAGLHVMHLVTPGVKTEMLEATEAGYGDHFDTSGWDEVTPEQWAAAMLEGVERDAAVVWPGGKTRLATIAARGPSRLLDLAAARMFKR